MVYFNCHLMYCLYVNYALIDVLTVENYKNRVILIMSAGPKKFGPNPPRTKADFKKISAKKWRDKNKTQNKLKRQFKHKQNEFEFEKQVVETENKKLKLLLNETNDDCRYYEQQNAVLIEHICFTCQKKNNNCKNQKKRTKKTPK